jgi:hypothetical protein
MKPHVALVDENTCVLIEWIGDRVRFGVTIEQDVSESGWFYVSDDEVECGPLTSEIVDWLRGLRSQRV